MERNVKILQVLINICDKQFGGNPFKITWQRANSSWYGD